MAIAHTNLRRSGRRGVTAIEYGILAALIIVALLGILSITGNDLAKTFSGIGNGLTGGRAKIIFGQYGTISGNNHALGYYCSNSNFGGFSNQNGMIFQSGCGTGTKESNIYNLETNTSLTPFDIIINPINSNKIIVPAMQGNGTGFEVPSTGLARIYFSRSGSNDSFYVTNTSAFTQQ